MELAGKGPFRHIGCEYVGVGNTLLHVATQSREFGESPNRLGESSKPRQLVANAARAIDSICPRYSNSCAHERVEQRQLVAHGGETVELNECERSGGGQVGPPFKEHT